MTPTSFSFSDARTARMFLKVNCRPGPGHGFWDAHRWMAEAERAANAWAREVGADRIAQMIATVKGQKGVRISGARCRECGAVLTAPESVAAGIGPECQGRAA